MTPTAKWPRIGTKLWFGPKRSLGWGWSPISWEGWAVVAAVLIGLLAPIPFLDEGGAIAGYLAWSALLTIALLICTVLKGTKPGGPKDFRRLMENREAS